MMSCDRTSKISRYFLTIPFILIIGLLGDRVYAQSTIAIPSELDFGEVLINNSKQKNFAITNQGVDTVIVNSISLSSPYSTSFSTPDTLPPGGARTVTVSFAPTSNGSNQTQTLIVGTAITSDVNPQVSLTGNGVTSPQLSLSTTSLTFDSTLVNSSNPPRRVVVVKNLGTQTTQNLEVSLSKSGTNSSAFSILYPTNSSLTLNIPAGGSDHVEVEFQPSSAGSYSAQLKIDHNDSAQGQLQVDLLGVGEAVALVPQLGSVTSVSMLEARVGETTGKDFTIFSQSDSLKILNITSSNPDFTISILDGPILGQNISSGDGLNVRAQFTPTQRDTQRATLYVLSNDPDESVKEIDIVGYGFAAEMSLSEEVEEFDFGSVQLGETVDGDVVTLRNLSREEDLNFTVTMASTEFEILTSDFVVSKGSSVPIGIQFIPSTLGSRSTFLKVQATNDPDSTAFVVRLLGNGTGAEVNISNENISFGDVDMGTIGSQPLVIENRGVNTLIATLNVSSPFSLDANTIEVESGSSRTVSVSFSPDVVGTSVGQIALSSNTWDVGRRDITIELSGNGKRGIRLSSQTLAFGSINLGDVKILPLVIENTSSSVLTSTLGAPGAPFSVSPRSIQIESGESQVVDVSFSPDEVDSFSENIVLNSDTRDTEQQRISIQLTGIGLRGQLSLDASRLDFGALRNNSESEDIDLSITNVGNAVVVISEVLIGDAQFTLQSPATMPISIEPDESRPFSFRFAPTVLGDRDVEVTFVSSDPLQPLYTLQIVGQSIVPDVVIFPESLDFANVSIPNFDIKKLTILNSGNDVLNIVNATSGNSAYSIEDSRFPLSVAAGERIELQIRFTPQSAGTVSSELTIENDDPDSPSFAVIMRGNGVRTNLSFEELDFGQVRIGGDPSLLRLNVTNEESASAEITTLPIVTPQFSTTPTTYNLDPGETVQIPIEFLPTAGQKFNADLILVDPNETQFRIALLGEGIEPDIEVRPPQIQFGTQRISEKDTTLFTIENVGSAELRIDAITLEQPEDLPFILLSQPPFTVAPGGTQAVQIAFAPTDSIVYQGTLSILSDDRAEPERIVSLSGRGVAPRLIVNSESDFNFGSVLRNGVASSGISEKSMDIEIANMGRDTLFIIDTIIEDDTGQFEILSSIENLSISPNENENVTAIFRPNRDGEQRASLQISLGRSGGRIERIALVGEGVSPRLDINLEQIVFGRTKINPPESLINADTTQFTITNRGTSILQIFGMEAKDNQQFQVITPSGPFTVDPDGRVNVQMRFVPIRADLQTISETIIDISSSVVIETNEVDQNSLEIVLKGEGTSSSIELPASLTFSDVRVDSSDEQILRIGNTGDIAILRASFSDSQFEIVGDELFNVEGGGRNVRLRFIPRSRNNNLPIEAVLTLEDTTTKRVVDVVLDGVGLQSNEEVVNSEGRSLDLIDFGGFRVHQGLGARRTLTIRNTGNYILNASIQLSSEQFSIPNITDGVVAVDPGAERDISIVFRPQVSEDIISTLSISSLGAPHKVDITLQGRGIAPSIELPNSVDMGEVVFNDGITASVEIANAGDDSLDVYEVTFSDYAAQLSIDGPVRFTVPPRASYIMPIRLLASDPELLENRGISISIEHESSNTPNPDSSSTTSIPISYTINDVRAPRVTLISPRILPTVESGNTSFSFSIEEDTGRLRPEQTTLWWRLGGQSDDEYQAELLDLSDTDVFSSKVGEITLTKPVPTSASRGIEYYVQVVDAAGNKSVLARDIDGNSIVPYELRYTTDRLIGEVFDGEGEVKNSHRMISVPVQLDDKDIGVTLSRIIGKDITKPENTEWRLFSWDRAAQKLQEYNPKKSNFGDFSVGSAFWLVARSAKVNMEVGQSVSVSTTEPFDDIVLSRGWNMVGTPFNFTVPWNNVRVGTSSAKSAGVEFYEFGSEYDSGSSAKKRGAWSSNQPLSGMMPWRGYAVWAPNNDMRLSIVPAEKDIVAAKLVAHSEFDWKIQIKVESDQGYDGNNSLGVYRNATEQRDIYDNIEPPMLWDSVSGYFSHADWDDFSGHYTSDIRGDIGRGAVWDFSVGHNLRNTRVKLEFDGVDSLPVEYSAHVISLDSYGKIDLRKEDVYEFESNGNQRFKIVIGEEDFIKDEMEKISPHRADLAENYPNPFNASTIIPFQLSDRGYVSLDIYNIAGQLVHSLIRGEKDPGVYEVQWDGRNQGGQPVGSGVYFSVLKQGKMHIARKLILVR
jgi:hypothetical protein